MTLSSMPSTTSVISTYTAFAASTMLVRSIINEVQSMTTQLIPESIREKILSKLHLLFGKPASEMTLIIDERCNGLCMNEVYEASRIYLQEKISPCNDTLKITKLQGDKDFTITVNNGEKIIDSYQGVMLKWVMICTESEKTNIEGSISLEKVEYKSFELCFLKKHKDVIIGSYLPYIMEFAKSREEANRVVKLESLGDGCWGSIKLDHPSTFDTLAMDPILKKAIMDDLDRFLERREYYRRVGKAWKRGYLLYGPPGTGKSSLIAAMGNYLKFHIYDLDLTSIDDNMSLISKLITTENRSIVVIEDIDCSIELQNRKAESHGVGETNVKLTLSGLLNFIDGLWSSCGDERIFVFTTNYKDKLDPALLRPGRMDMHIHMSYLTPSGFRVLAFNYLGINRHPLFTDIEDLLAELEVTPATVAEELMRGNDDPDAALESLRDSLLNKKSQVTKSSPQGEKEYNGGKEEIQETPEHDSKVKGTKEKVRRKPRKRKNVNSSRR